MKIKIFYLNNKYINFLFSYSLCDAIAVRVLEGRKNV